MAKNANPRSYIARKVKFSATERQEVYALYLKTHSTVKVAQHFHAYTNQIAEIVESISRKPIKRGRPSFEKLDALSAKAAKVKGAAKAPAAPKAEGAAKAPRKSRKAPSVSGETQVAVETSVPQAQEPVLEQAAA